MTRRRRRSETRDAVLGFAMMFLAILGWSGVLIMIGQYGCATLGRAVVNVVAAIAAAGPR
jgi:hypothetical protein